MEPHRSRGKILRILLSRTRVVFARLSFKRFYFFFFFFFSPMTNGIELELWEHGIAVQPVSLQVQVTRITLKKKKKIKVFKNKIDHIPYTMCVFEGNLYSLLSSDALCALILHDNYKYCKEYSWVLTISCYHGLFVECRRFRNFGWLRCCNSLLKMNSGSLFFFFFFLHFHRRSLSIWFDDKEKNLDPVQHNPVPEYTECTEYTEYTCYMWNLHF